MDMVEWEGSTVITEKEKIKFGDVCTVVVRGLWKSLSLKVILKQVAEWGWRPISPGRADQKTA